MNPTDNRERLFVVGVHKGLSGTDFGFPTGEPTSTGTARGIAQPDSEVPASTILGYSQGPIALKSPYRYRL